MRAEDKDKIDNALAPLANYQAPGAPSWADFEHKQRLAQKSEKESGKEPGQEKTHRTHALPRVAVWSAIAAAIIGLALWVMAPKPLVTPFDLPKIPLASLLRPTVATPEKEKESQIQVTHSQTIHLSAITEADHATITSQEDSSSLPQEHTKQIDEPQKKATPKQPESRPAVQQTPQWWHNTHQAPPRKSAPRSSKISTGLFASLGYGAKAHQGGTSMASEATTMTYSVGKYNGEIDFYPEDFTHHFPVSVGASLQFELLPRFNIETGLLYTYLSSTSRKSPNMTYEYTQKLHYIGIPLNLSYDFVRNRRLDFYATAGAMVEYAVAADVDSRVRSISGDVSHTSQGLSTHGVMLSFNAAVGLNVHLTPHVGLYVEPGATTYLPNDTHPVNFRTQSAVQFNMRVGVRVKL